MSSIPCSPAETSLLDVALAYADRGWNLFPLHTCVEGKCSCWKTGCDRIAKHPMTQNGFKDATADPAVIRQWWTATPTANIGIRTGAGSDIWVVGPDGQQGIDALAELVRQHGGLPDTPHARTGGGGMHYYYRWPSSDTITNRRNHHGLPIDVRGAGGYVVAPPSKHKSGAYYTWEVSPEEVAPAEAPAWLLDWARTPAQKTKVISTPLATVNGLPAAGKLVFTVQSDRAEVHQRAVEYLAKCNPAISGQGGHAQTFEVARAIVYGFDLGTEVGFELLSQHYNPKCLPPWTDTDLRHKCAEASTVPFDKPRGYLLQNQDGQMQGGGHVVVGSVQGEDIESLPMPTPAPWPTLLAEALHGLAGEIVQTLAPETESDPVAILGQLLVAFGSAVGRGPHFLVEGDAHHANLFTCLVGESSRGRKGTSRGRVMQLMTHADEQWCIKRLASGLSSGEGLVWAVRDPITKREPIKKQGKVVDYQDVETDAGVADKRLLVAESEFAQALRVMQREGNSLSPTIRTAWESGNLRTLVKNNPACATGAHISIVAHVTKPELVKYMKDTEALNGFANRFIWLCVRRSRKLPDGGRALDLSPFGTRLNFALAAARNVGLMHRTPAAGHLWHDAYAELTAERVGLYGAVTGRAEAQVLRLSMLYALLDCQAVIDVPHLRAALALWSYADASAKLIFGAAPEDPLPGLILSKLQESLTGLTRTELHNAFARNLPPAKLVEALATLRDRGEATPEKVQTAGRPAERWKASAGRKNEESPLLAPNGTDLTSFVRSPAVGRAAAEEAVEL